jgi:hypothetical protein
MTEVANKAITPGYIKKLRLDENKIYAVLMINKNLCNNGVDTVEPARELLQGKLVSQHGYIFIFECTNKRKVKKRVCINKIDYIINKKIITELK